LEILVAVLLKIYTTPTFVSVFTWKHWTNWTRIFLCVCYW